MSKYNRVPRVEKADMTGYNVRCRKWLKKRKNRAERRRAKCNPEVAATYNKHHGWLS